MKKFGKTLALLAAGALLFGSVFMSCSSGGSDDDDDDVSVTGVSLDTTSLELKVGEEATLTATVAPENATNKEVSWSTGSKEIATVDGGKVTGNGKGSTTVTVTTKDGEKTASCTVTVYESTTLSLSDGNTVVIKDAGDAGITATVTDSTGTATEATVSVDTTTGAVTVADASSGSTLYTATYTDGEIDTTSIKDAQGKSVTATVLSDITIIAEDSAASVAVDDTLALTTDVADGVAVTWKSSDESIATVSSSGVVTGVAEGSVTITASADGYADGTITLTVTAAQSTTSTKDVTYLASEITETELAAMSPIPSAGASTKLSEGTYSIWGGSGSIVTAASKMAIQINTGKTTPVAIVSATNMTGADFTAVPKAGDTVKLVNYVKVNTPASGSTKIKMNISCDAPDTERKTPGALGYWDFWVLVTDTDGNILAVKELGDLSSTTYSATDVDIGTADTGDEICIGFARSGGSGGLKIHSISLETTPAAAKVTSIQVSSNPTKTNYALNETFDSTGLAVTANYSDGTSKTLSSAKYTLSSPDMTSTGDKTVTVTYSEEITAKFTINVGTLSSIEVTAPTKTTYSLTDTSLDLSGLKVTAAYSNGYSKDVTDDAETSDFTAGSAGEQTITVSYKDGSVTEALTKTFTITVENKTATGLTITTPPTKLSYLVGEELDLSGLVVSVAYSSGDPETVTYSESNASLFTTSGFSSSEALKSQTVTVTYSGVSATFDVAITEKAKFSGFKASDLGSTDDASDYKTFSDTNGTWTVNRAKYQATQTMTASDGTEFKGRIKFNKANDDDDGTFTLSNVTVGSVLRIDGGNANSGQDVRKVSFSGTDKDSETWDASYMGTFYVTATSDTVVLKSETNEFCIYAITIVESAAEKTTVSETPTYSNPVVSLTIASGEASSETSQTCDQNASVTASATVADVSTVVIYSDGTAETKTSDFDGTLTWTGATANENDNTTATVDTATAQTISITASYTVGEGDDAKTYTSDAISLTVQDASANYHSVTFYDGTTVLSTASVKGGDKVETPTTPTKAGYTFSKWVTEADGTTEYSFDTETADTKDDISIYASWTTAYSSDYTELFATYGTSVYDVTTSLSSTVTPTEATTYYFASGISFVATASDSMGKNSVNFTVGESTVSATNRLVPNKAKAGATSSVIKIPVAGNCTVTVLWYNNGISDRGAYLSATNGKFTAVSGPSDFANSYSETDGKTAWSTCNKQSKANNVSVFTYEGSGDTLALTNSTSSGEAGGGGIYIYGVIVNYTTGE